MTEKRLVIAYYLMFLIVLTTVMISVLYLM